MGCKNEILKMQEMAIKQAVQKLQLLNNCDKGLNKNLSIN